MSSRDDHVHGEEGQGAEMTKVKYLPMGRSQPRKNIDTQLVRDHSTVLKSQTQGDTNHRVTGDMGRVITESYQVSMNKL